MYFFGRGGIYAEFRKVGLKSRIPPKPAAASFFPPLSGLSIASTPAGLGPFGISSRVALRDADALMLVIRYDCDLAELRILISHLISHRTPDLQRRDPRASLLLSSIFHPPFTFSKPDRPTVNA